MATLEQLEEGIRRAHAAGKTEDVKALGAAYRAMQAGGGSDIIQLKGKVSDLPSRQQQRQSPDLMTATAATISGMVNGIPVLGPAARGITDAMIGGGAALMGGDYGQTIKGLQQRRQELAEAAPVSDIAGNIGGAIGSFGAAGSVPALAGALGFTGSIPAQMTNSALSTLGIGTVDNMVRGMKPTDALTSAAGPAAIAGAFPGAAHLVRKGVGAVARPIATMANRGNEAIRRVGAAIGQDRRSGQIMSAADDAVARGAGAEVVNADRFGSAIRSLARTAANISDDARNTFANLTQDRFHTQGQRATGFIQRLMGGATDDLALQEQLRTAAQNTNRAAYRTAYDAPASKAIWTPEIRNLMQADPFRRAIQEADTTAANAAAVSGQRAVRNPFAFTQDGGVTLRELPGGGRALPNLEFWDIVQRNLRAQADQAQVSGNRLLATQIGQMRTQLLNTLDSAVPQFRTARRGAAAFFGAEDAIEAGRKAATTVRQVPEMRRAVAAMSDAERDAFSVGYASELMDRINATGDRVNVINNIFGSAEAREKIAIALGPQRAREIEGYVRAEQILDLLRNATQGNSTTAQQLISAGVIGGAGGIGFIGSGGDLGSAGGLAFLAAMGRRGMQMMGKRVDDEVMRIVADMLASQDPAQIQRAIQNASFSQQHMDAMDAIMRGLNIAARGAATGSMAAVN